VNSGNWQRIEAPPFSNRRIIQEAEELTKSYARDFKKVPASIFTINFDHIYENFIYPKYGINLEEDCDLGYDNQGKKLLGRFDLATNTAFIDASLGPGSRDWRRTFTCWHEVGGHGILQGPWLKREMGRFCQTRYIETTEASIDEQTEYKLERQANLFASHAAAPSWFLRYVLHTTYQPGHPFRYVGPGRYSFYVNKTDLFREIKDFNHLCWTVANYLSGRFGGLSREALGYRIAEVGFVIDDCHPGLRLNRSARSTARFTEPSHVLAAVGCR
jgi:hypothetical protein